VVTITSLLLPIVVSAVLVFIASSIIHMALGYHGSDFGKLPGEDGVMAALRDAKTRPGDYIFPTTEDPKLRMSPEMQEKCKRGPAGTLTVLSGMNMGRSLGLWFAYSLLVSVFVAYITGRALAPGTEYLHVFQIAGAVAFLGYAGSEPHRSIWWGRPWTTTLKNMFDGLIYGLVTAGAFGWLWPA
jgi:hypothetical protein